MDVMLEEKFTEYRLIKRLAVGGMAEVFLAIYQFSDGQEIPVVIKRLLPQYNNNEKIQKAFLEEGLILSSLKHPNIVQLLDFGEVEETSILVLEYVEGADLSAFLKACPKERLENPCL